MSNFAIAARKLGIFLGAFFVVVLVPAETFAQVEKYDIAGVRVGMSPSAAKAAIAKVNPEYEITELKNKEGKVVRLDAEHWLMRDLGNPVLHRDRVVDKFIALTNDAGVIWSIKRQQELAKPIPLKTLDDALKKKYGSPSPSKADESMLVWAFDRQGRQVSEKMCDDPT